MTGSPRALQSDRHHADPALYMWFGNKKPAPLGFADPFAEGQDPRRSAPRQKTDTLSCPLGDVIDISATGVRIRCGSKPPFSEGAVTTLKFVFNGGKLPVSVQERWRKRHGFRGSYEIGLKFVNNPPNVMNAIGSLIKFGFLCPDAVAGESPEPKAQAKPRKKLRVSVDLPDYYAVLNVPPDADDKRVHTAYRQLARQYHPDANKDPGAQDRFIGICEAYKVLSDPDQRKTYDLRQAG
jgi:DnaJ-like protein/PilZ domain-containing protein